MNSNEVCRLFLPGIAAAVATDEMYDTRLYPVEELAVQKAVPKRRREFAAGRACGRAALADLGGPIQAIPRGNNREPVWPEGFVGSIAHCDGKCLAVAGKSIDALSIGVDVEQAVPLGEKLIDFVCLPAEITQIGAMPQRSLREWATLVFSAKEAFYKCYWPVARSFLGFHDVCLKLIFDGEESCGYFHAVMVTEDKPFSGFAMSIQGQWRIEGDFVYTGASLPQDASGHEGDSIDRVR